MSKTTDTSSMYQGGGREVKRARLSEMVFWYKQAGKQLEGKDEKTERM